MLLAIIGCIILICAAIVIYVVNKKKTSDAKFNDYLTEIDSLNLACDNLLKRYISDNDLKHFNNNYVDLIQRIKRLKSFLSAENKEIAEHCITNFNSCCDNQIEHNARFVISEKKRLNSFFSNIDGKSLDDQQRTAVVTNQDNNLVVAGAGSGKTLTIAAKVKYLCEIQEISPDEILLIAFTKKSAEEMSARIQKMGININAVTFHKLGLGIISEVRKKRPDVFDSDEFQLFIEEYFTNEVLDNDEVMKSLILFFSYYLNIPADLEKFDSIGAAYEAERTSDLETLKTKYFLKKNKEYTPEKRTLHGEKVKSLEELAIANFLFLNGVNYEYERIYPYDTGDPYRKQYRPDFYLSDYDIYLEHFGIDKDSKCPWLSEVEEEKYLEGIEWKRNLHKEKGTKLIETYSWYNSKGILESKLKEILDDNGIAVKQPDYRELYSKAYNDVGDKVFKQFIQLCTTFISLFKANGYKSSDLTALNYNSENFNSKYFTERTFHFKNIIKPIIEAYEEKLRKTGKVDFSDMINQAADYIRQGNIQTKYKYIIVDEFQDISIARSNLVKAIRDCNEARLFAVGDDWQSIYRFAGSDISLFTRFKYYFGTSEVMRIEKTYRNSQQLIDVASDFVMENPQQIKKKLKSGKELKDPVIIDFITDNPSREIDSCMDRIISEFGIEHSIMILGRTNYDIDVLLESNSFRRKGQKLLYKGYQDLDVSFMSVHKSKGLEADNVIVINFNNDRLGFPNKIADDPVLELVLNKGEQFRYAEERRLLYVAMTRTRNRVFFIANSANPSEFTHELKKHKDVIHLNTLGFGWDTYCPVCKTGRLLVRKNSNTEKNFVACTNYPQCDFTLNNIDVLRDQKRCSCGGFMVRRNGRYGEFWGCTNYPHCRNTYEITIEEQSRVRNKTDLLIKRK